MDIDPKKLCILSILAAMVLFILMLLYVWNFTIDDAFISFRYSEHLASGFGLVWNVDQPPVEGYSNFLWILIIAFSFLFKLNPIFSAKLIGLVSVFGIIIIFWFIINDIFKNNVDKFLAFTLSTVLILVNPHTATHAISGMETMFYTFLLLGVAYSAWKIITSNSSKFIWLFAFTALLLSLTRPEGIIISLALIFTVILISKKKKDNSITLNSFLPILILFLIPIIIYQLFRVYYFQELLPLPFIVKVVNGVTYPAEFITALIYLVPFIIIIMISFYILNPKMKSHKNQQKTYFNYFLLILVVIFFFANVEYVFTPLMNYSQRFYYPSFVLIYVTFGIATTILFKEISKIDTKFPKFTKIIFTLFVILILVNTNVYGIDDLKDKHDYSISFENSYYSIGETLNQYSSDNFTVAFADAGAVAYLSRWNFLDLGGLNNKFIAHNGITKAYLKEEDPELVILVSINGEIKNGCTYEYVMENNYTRLDPIKHDFYYFIPFLKPKIKDYESIKESLEIVSIESNR